MPWKPRTLADKVCPVCGRTFRPRRTISEYCGLVCMYQSRQPTEPKSWRPNHDGYLAGEMVRDGVRTHVLQHRWLMEKHLGRPLTKNEVVHHRDGDRTNNDLANLELRQRSEHVREHAHVNRPWEHAHKPRSKKEHAVDHDQPA